MKIKTFIFSVVNNKISTVSIFATAVKKTNLAQCLQLFLQMIIFIHFNTFSFFLMFSTRIFEIFLRRIASAIISATRLSFELILPLGYWLSLRNLVN